MIHLVLLSRHQWRKKHNSKQKMTDHSDDINEHGFLDSDLTRPPTKKIKSDDFEFHAPPGMTNNAFVLSGREMWEAFCCKEATEVLRKTRVSVKIVIDKEGSKTNEADSPEQSFCLLKDHGHCINSTGTSSLSCILSSVVGCVNEKDGGVTKETSIGPALGPKLGAVSKKISGVWSNAQTKWEATCCRIISSCRPDIS